MNDDEIQGVAQKRVAVAAAMRLHKIDAADKKGQCVSIDAGCGGAEMNADISRFGVRCECKPTPSISIPEQIVR